MTPYSPIACACRFICLTYTTETKFFSSFVTENEIATAIVDSCYKVHTSLAPGLLESVYETFVNRKLRKRGFKAITQQGIAMYYDNLKLDIGFRADIVVEEKVIIEIKSVENLAPVHFKQLLTYLKITGLKLGLLINFNESIIKTEIHRMANHL